MPEKETNIKTLRLARTLMVAGGTAIGYASFLFTHEKVGNSMMGVALCTCVFGCYLWARLKGRLWIWMLFGLLAPAGFLILAFLRNKSQEPTQSAG